MNRPYTVNALAAALVALALAVVPALTAQAADEIPPQDAGITVTIPSSSPIPSDTPVPTDEPTDEPTDAPDDQVPPPAGGGGSGGGSGSGGGAGGGGNAGGGGSGTVIPPTEPTITPKPGTGALAVTDKDIYTVGENMTASATGYTPGEQVQVVLYSDPILIGNFTADASGAVSTTFALPQELLPGTHTVQFTGWASDTISVKNFLIAGGPVDASAGPGGSLPSWFFWALGILAVLVVAGLVTYVVVRLVRSGEPAAQAAGV
ncbi:hypothetical protein [Compostimonas suwonensis]|nr:hypothetical protein [Compostimonas suwonensis]